MRRLVIAAASISLGLTGAGGIAVAQDQNVQGIITSADGSNVRSTAGMNPVANGEGGTVIYGDINFGPGGTTVSEPVYVVEGDPPSDPVPAGAPEPAPITTTETTTTETAVADTASTAPSDLDADNYPDDLEWDLGLDPNNADTDADGVADGDEINLYGTEPTIADTDGDRILDGEELFGINTDPLVWNDVEGQSSEAATSEPAAGATEPVTEAPVESEALAQETTESMTAIDGDAAALGPGGASAAPGTVTRTGSTVLGPDGTYSVVDNAPSSVTIPGDTGTLALPAPESTVAGCGSYPSWYDAQVAYEAAGRSASDPRVVEALDPDLDGIACEEVM